MLENFAELKKQLQELSPVINGFKSEAVQLRLVELIFLAEGESADADQEDDKPNDKKRPRKARKKKSKSASKSAKTREPSKTKKSAGGGRKGSATILGELIEDGFFKSKRSISAIMEQASSQKARNFKANEMSGPLARFVRDGRLKRQKNSDGQYEYYK